jgi:hypothetical protein
MKELEKKKKKKERKKIEKKIKKKEKRPPGTISAQTPFRPEAQPGKTPKGYAPPPFSR